MDESAPAEIWDGEFGREWTERNRLTVEELDDLYHERYRLTRTELNREFLGDFDRTIDILEVGSNVGSQLRALQSLGFESLTGVDILEYALREAREFVPEGEFLRGDALDLPFEDGAFDLVFTSGTLIHMPPEDLPASLREIARCSNRYIWGCEYFAPSPTKIEYRDHEDLLWKDDFASRYQEHCDLSLVSERRLQYTDSENVDTMFLLES